MSVVRLFVVCCLCVWCVGVFGVGVAFGMAPVGTSGCVPGSPGCPLGPGGGSSGEPPTPTWNPPTTTQQTPSPKPSPGSSEPSEPSEPTEPTGSLDFPGGDPGGYPSGTGSGPGPRRIDVAQQSGGFPGLGEGCFSAGRGGVPAAVNAFNAAALTMAAADRTFVPLGGVVKVPFESLSGADKAAAKAAGFGPGQDVYKQEFGSSVPEKTLEGLLSNGRIPTQGERGT